MEALGDLRLRFDSDPGTGPLMGTCIYHEDDTASMAIYEDHVYCFGCQSYKWPDEFLTDVSEVSHMVLGDTIHPRRTASRKPGKILDYLPISMAETYHTWLMGPFSERLEWLHARGLRDDVLMANRIGHCGNGFTIPIISDTGELLSIRYRRDDLWAESRCPKYWGTTGKNGVETYWPKRPLRVNGRGGEYYGHGVFLCEGELDALRLVQEGFVALSLTNGAGASKHIDPEWFKEIPEVYTVFDQDEAGWKATATAREILGKKAKAVLWPSILANDVTEFLQRWPVTELEKYINGAGNNTTLIEPPKRSGKGSAPTLRERLYL